MYEEKNRKNSMLHYFWPTLYFYLFFFYHLFQKLHQPKSHSRCSTITEVLPAVETDKMSVVAESEFYCNKSHGNLNLLISLFVRLV
jgi:hypothetical protein